MTRRVEIIIGKGGQTRAIYSPTASRLLSTLGTTETRRASHVEPTAELGEAALRELVKANPGTTPDAIRALLPTDAWWADLTPVGGPVLGPFHERDVALAAELTWLQANNIPNCRDGRCGIQIEPPTAPVLREPDLPG